MKRRHFIHTLAMAGAAGATTQKDAAGYFTLAQRDGRWWFITPEGKLMESIIALLGCQVNSDGFWQLWDTLTSVSDS